MAFQTKNNAESLVTDNPLAQAATTLNVTATEGANFPSTFPYLLTIWDGVTYANPGDDSGMEIVKCTARSTDALTIVRAQESTSDVAHTQGEKVAMLITANVVSAVQLYDAVVASSGGDYTLPSAAFTDGAKSVFVKDGTYTETSDITIPTNGCLVGETRGGAIIDFNDATTLDITLNSGSRMSNLTIKGNDITTGTAVGAAASDNIRIDNVDFLECVSCVKTVGSDFIISNCDFEDFTTTGVTMSGARGMCQNCEFDGAGNTVDCVYVLTSNDQSVIGNKMYGQFECGIYVNAVTRTRIIDNLIFPTSGDRDRGIWLAGASTKTIMVGNTVDGFTGTPGDGIDIESTANAFTFVGNVVTNCDVGIDFANCTSGIIVGNVMTGNTAWSDSTGSSGVQEGYQLT